MKQVRIRVHNTWPAGRAAGGELDQTRHNVWCKALRKEVAYRRDNGFDITDEMQNRQNLDVIVYMHTDRAGRKATNNTDAYRDCIRQSLLEAHLTNSTERIERLRVVAEPKSKPENRCGTTIDICWKD